MAEYRRTQVNDQAAGGSAIPGPEAIKQIASPVDGYYRPTERAVADNRDPNSLLQDLASGLMKYEPKLQQYIGQKREEYTKEQIAAGEAARRDNQQAWKDAVNEGKAPAGANPWQMKGYMNQSGKLDAMDYAAKARLDIMKDPVWGSNNPNEVKAWMDKYRADYLKTNGQNKNRDWSDGFEPGMAHGENTIMAQHIAGRQQAIVQGNIDNVGLLTQKLLDMEGERQRDSGGYDTEEEFAAARKQTAALIEAQASQAIKNGSNGKDVNHATALAIINKAKEADDPTIIEDYIMKGPRPVTPEIRALAETARVGIQRDKNSQILQQHQIDSLPHVRRMQEHAERTAQHSEGEWARMEKSNNREEEARGLLSDLFSQQRRTGKLDSTKLARLGELKPSDVTWLEGSIHGREKMQADIVTDQHALARMRLRVITDPTVTEQDIYSGVFNNRWTVAEANSAEDTMHRLRKEGDTLTHDAKYQTGVRNIAAAVGIREGKKQIDAIVDIPDAVEMYHVGYTEIYKTNPKKLTPMEQNEAEVLLRDNVMKRYAPDAETGGAAKDLQKTKVQGPANTPPPKPTQDSINRLAQNPGNQVHAKQFIQVFGEPAYKEALAEIEKRKPSNDPGAITTNIQ